MGAEGVNIGSMEEIQATFCSRKCLSNGHVRLEGQRHCTHAVSQPVIEDPRKCLYLRPDAKGEPFTLNEAQA
jgi:hypothetical protein